MYKMHDYMQTVNVKLSRSSESRLIEYTVFVCRLGKVITQCHLVAMLSRYLKELKIAVQCLGIKPKTMYK